MRPFVYTYHSFAHAGNCAGLAEYPLWISAPARRRGEPAPPGPWRGWTIHQYDVSPLDRNVFHGSRRELTRLGYDPR